MAGNPFRVDWSNLNEVKKYADELDKGGPGQVVLKYPGRPNYNIGFLEYVDRYIRDGAEVVYRTRDNGQEKEG